MMVIIMSYDVVRVMGYQSNFYVRVPNSNRIELKNLGQFEEKYTRTILISARIFEAFLKTSLLFFSTF